MTVVLVVAKAHWACPTCGHELTPSEIMDQDRRAREGKSQLSHESATASRRRCFTLVRLVDRINIMPL